MRLYRRGASIGDLVMEFGVNRVTIYRELNRGYTGKEYNGRPDYSATKAQSEFFRSLGRRGRKRKVQDDAVD